MNIPQEKVCIVCHRTFPCHIQECPEDRVRLAEKDSRIGTIFDVKYEILDFIGAGGLSRVYKARHIELNKTLALKVLKSSELIDLQRFRREAVSIGQLDHPNIARVFSFAVAPNGSPYMALEFLEGRDLAEWLAKDGPLNIKQALQAFEQVTAALEHAHSRNIIHRDIKPGNIIMMPNQDNTEITVKVVDFGMAKFQLEGGVMAQKLTQEGEVFGTRQYISPEQYRGVVADARSDIYSLGVTMYEAVLKDGSIPEILRPIISKATETDPTERFQTAAALRQELLRLGDSTKALDVTNTSGYVNVGGRAGKDLFGTIYFWSMLGGMLVLAICAVIVIQHRLAALDSISNSSNPMHKASLSHVGALSLAATQKQAETLIRMEQNKEAAQLYEDWLQRNRNSQKWSALCVVENKLASLYMSLNNHDLAMKRVQEGLALAEKHGLKSGYEVEDLLMSMANILHAEGNLQSAMDYARKVIELTKDVEFIHEIDSQLGAIELIAECQRGLGHFDLAERATNEGLDLATKSYGENSTECGRQWRELAIICEQQKQYTKALQYIEKARECFSLQNMKYNQYLTSAVAKQASIEVAMNDFNAAKRDYDFVADRVFKSDVQYKNEATDSVRVIMRKLAPIIGKSDDLSKWK